MKNNEKLKLIKGLFPNNRNELRTQRSIGK